MERLSISVPKELALRIRDAARADGASLSAWLARAAESQLLPRNASEAIAAWEREHGGITDHEVAAAARGLGISGGPHPPFGHPLPQAGEGVDATLPLAGEPTPSRLPPPPAPRAP